MEQPRSETPNSETSLLSEKLTPATLNKSKEFFKHWMSILKAELGFSVPTLLSIEYVKEVYDIELESSPLIPAVIVGNVAGIIQMLGLLDTTQNRAKLKAIFKLFEESRHAVSMYGMALNVVFMISLLLVKPTLTSNDERIKFISSVMAIATVIALLYFHPTRRAIRKLLCNMENTQPRQWLKKVIHRADDFLRSSLAGYQLTVIWPVIAKLIKQQRLLPEPITSISRLTFAGLYGSIIAMLTPFLSHATSQLIESLEHNVAVIVTYFLEELENAILLAEASEKERSFAPLVAVLSMILISLGMAALVVSCQKPAPPLESDQNSEFAFFDTDTEYDIQKIHDKSENLSNDGKHEEINSSPETALISKKTDNAYNINFLAKQIITDIVDKLPIPTNIAKDEAVQSSQQMPNTN